MFLLIYSIIQEAIAAQLFSATFTAATAIIQIIILALTYQPSSYKPDKAEFLKAMEKEMADHMQHWELVLRSSVPEGVKVFNSVWQMKRKRRIETQEIFKRKARLNFNGSTMIQGQHYVR